MSLLSSPPCKAPSPSCFSNNGDKPINLFSVVHRKSPSSHRLPRCSSSWSPGVKANIAYRSVPLAASLAILLWSSPGNRRVDLWTLWFIWPLFATPNLPAWHKRTSWATEMASFFNGLPWNSALEIDDNCFFNFISPKMVNSCGWIAISWQLYSSFGSMCGLWVFHQKIRSGIYAIKIAYSFNSL